MSEQTRYELYFDATRLAVTAGALVGGVVAGAETFAHTEAGLLNGEWHVADPQNVPITGVQAPTPIEATEYGGTLAGNMLVGAVVASLGVHAVTSIIHGHLERRQAKRNQAVEKSIISDIN